MSWEQCLIECLNEAREKGYQAAKNGESAKQAPRVRDYQHRHPADFVSANRYHEHWMAGWEVGLKDFPRPSAPYR